jgi:hypothetical protein
MLFLFIRRRQKIKEFSKPGMEKNDFSS